MYNIYQYIQACAYTFACADIHQYRSRSIVNGIYFQLDLLIFPRGITTYNLQTVYNCSDASKNAECHMYRIFQLTIDLMLLFVPRMDNIMWCDLHHILTWLVKQNLRFFPWEIQEISA